MAGSITNPIQLCNLVLFQLKQPRIISFNDDSLSAEGCRFYYNQTVESLLSEYNWDFALERAILRRHYDGDRHKRLDGTWAETEIDYQNRIAGYNMIGYAHAYTMPANNLRLVRVYNGDNKLLAYPEQSTFPAYAYEGNLLFTNESAVKIHYISSDANFSLYSPLFKDLLEAELVVKMSLFFEDSGSRFEARSARAEMLRRKAKMLNSQQVMVGFELPNVYAFYRNF